MRLSLQPHPGASRRETLIHTLVLLGRISVLIRLCRFIFVDGYRHIRARGLGGCIKEFYDSLRNVAIRLMLSLPSARRKIAEEMDKTRAQLRSKILKKQLPDGVTLTETRTLPEEGRSREWLEGEWANLRNLEKGDVTDGKVSGTVYHGGEELNKIITDAMHNFLVANPLHSDVFPAVRKMESEIISMCLNLYSAPNGAGTTTSGGTESIVMAVKTYRDWAKATKGITKPEMVVPASAHAAFFKAAGYFGIKVHSIPVNLKTRRADVGAMRRAINPNTIMLVGSAPNFPDGIIDPITHLAALARKHKIGMHVDCCLGSFLMPFLGRAGLGDGVEKFDFSVPGVTSISCDVHKYAFCPKGVSVIMYHTAELRRHQYYVITDWPGGVYASPSLAGSRPGALLAGSWAVMNHIGAKGYTESCATIVTAARSFAAAIKSRFPADLHVLGNPMVSVVAFSSKTVNIYALGDLMSKKGWHLSALSNPAALHMAFTLPSSGSVDKLVEGLAEALEQLKASPQAEGDMVALYGLGQTSVGPHVVDELARTYLDVLYE